jgi:ribose 5-phosphate isomerase
MGSIANNKNDGPNIAVTDNGNYIVDLFFTAPITDVALAAKEIKATVGSLCQTLGMTCWEESLDLILEPRVSR